MTSGRTRTKSERRAAGQVRLEVSISEAQDTALQKICHVLGVSSKAQAIRLLIERFHQ